MNPFDFDLLLIHQRAFAISERYDVLDSNGSPWFHVRREMRFFGMMLAGGARFIAAIAGLYFAYRYLFAGRLAAAIIVLWAMRPIGEVFYLLLAPFRHIFLSLPGAPEDQPILSVSQDTKLSWIRRFTLFDDLGGPVACFHKNQWTNLWRRVWRVLTPGGDLICEIREDDWIRCIARRIFGNPFGLLRADFHFYDPYGVRMGVYHRRWTVLDRYVLDLREDPWRRLDRRVALAAGILLDTGEQR